MGGERRRESRVRMALLTKEWLGLRVRITEEGEKIYLDVYKKDEVNQVFELSHEEVEELAHNLEQYLHVYR